jgi:hypothetical protein
MFTILSLFAFAAGSPDSRNHASGSPNHKHLPKVSPAKNCPRPERKTGEIRTAGKPRRKKPQKNLRINSNYRLSEYIDTRGTGERQPAPTETTAGPARRT